MKSKMMAIVMALSLVGGMAQAAPVANEDRVELDFRRTTLVVQDIDKSLALYRDALGMQVIYDNMLRNPREATSNEEADFALRLVFLRANDDFVGILGLMEYEKPERPAPEAMPGPFMPGSIVLLFNTDDLENKFAAASAVDGVTVRTEPRDTTYPSYDGKTEIPVRMSVLIDPDGHVIELNDLLMDPEDMAR